MVPCFNSESRLPHMHPFLLPVTQARTHLGALPPWCHPCKISHHLASLMVHPCPGTSTSQFERRSWHRCQLPLLQRSSRFSRLRCSFYWLKAVVSIRSVPRCAKPKPCIPLLVASSNKARSTAAAGKCTYRTTLPLMKTFLTDD